MFEIIFRQVFTLAWYFQPSIQVRHILTKNLWIFSLLFRRSICSVCVCVYVVSLFLTSLLRTAWLCCAVLCFCVTWNFCWWWRSANVTFIIKLTLLSYCNNNNCNNNKNKLGLSIQCQDKFKFLLRLECSLFLFLRDILNTFCIINK